MKHRRNKLLICKQHKSHHLRLPPVNAHRLQSKTLLCRPPRQEHGRRRRRSIGRKEARTPRETIQTANRVSPLQHSTNSLSSSFVHKITLQTIHPAISYNGARCQQRNSTLMLRDTVIHNNHDSIGESYDRSLHRTKPKQERNWRSTLCKPLAMLCAIIVERSPKSFGFV